MEKELFKKYALILSGLLIWPLLILFFVNISLLFSLFFIGFPPFLYFISKNEKYQNKIDTINTLFDNKKVIENNDLTLFNILLIIISIQSVIIISINLLVNLLIFIF